MATKRKKTKRKGSRRRMSGITSGIDIMGSVGAAVGAVGITYLINGPMKTTSYVAPLGAVVGLLLPKFVKAPIAKSIGVGLIAGAAISIAQNASLISGVPGVYVGSRGNMGPISSLAGNSPSQRIAANVRRNAAGSGRVVLGSMGPIQSVAGGVGCNM